MSKIKYDTILGDVRQGDNLLTVASNNVFPGITERNAASRTWGLTSDYIYAVTTFSGNDLYKYIGTTKSTAGTTVDSDWLEVTTVIRGPAGTNESLAGIAGNALLMKDPHNDAIVAAPAQLDSDRVRFSTSVETTSSTVFVSQNLGIKGAGLAFGVFDVINDRTGFLVAYGFDENGSVRPFYRSFGSTVMEDFSNARDTVDIAENLSQTFTSTANRLVREFIIYPSEDVSDAFFSIRYMDESVTQEVFSITMDLVANVANTLEIPQGLFAEAGTSYMIEAVDVRLLGIMDSGEFVPSFSLKSHVFTQVSLVDDLVITSVLEGKTGDDRLNYNSLKNLPGPGDGISKPSIHNLLFELPARVDLGYVLSTETPYTYSVTNHSEITSLELFNGTTKLADIAIPTIDGLHTGEADLTALSTLTETTLRLRMVINGSIDSNTFSVNVRNIIPSETAFFGSTSTADLSTIDLSTFTQYEIEVERSFDATFTLANTERAGILAPNIFNLTILDRSFNVDITDQFIMVEDVRTEGDITYNAYTHQNNSGVDGNLQTTIKAT